MQAGLFLRQVYVPEKVHAREQKIPISDFVFPGV
jgi:hypothetical protein